MGLRIYIAGPWAHRQDMPAIAARLERAGHIITHPWWEFDGDETNLSKEFLFECALKDVHGVLNADAMVVINSAKSEGKATEQGIAIAEEKPIIVVGKRGEHSNNIFHYLALYRFVDTVEDAVKELEGLTFDYTRNH